MSSPIYRAGTHETTSHDRRSSKGLKSLDNMQRRFAILFHASPAAKIVTRYPDGTPLQMNEELIRLMGYEPDTSPEHTPPLPELFSSADVWDSIVRELSRSKVIRYREVALRSPQGRSLFAVGSFGKVEIGGEKCVLASFVDITEKRKAEEELQKALVEERAAKADLVDANQRSQFLENASFVLAESLDYERQLQQVAKLAVPEIADWCAVDVLDDKGVIRRVAVVHADPGKVDLAYRITSEYPPDPDSKTGVYEVIRTGRSWLYGERDLKETVEKSRDERYGEMIEALAMQSLLVVPLQAHGRPLGALILALSESKRRFGKKGVSLAEDLARRAALAIDNARLHREVVQANRLLDARVRERTEELTASNRELEAFTYSVSHDLRAPLRHVRGYSQLLDNELGGNLNEKGERYLRNIGAAVDNMETLIDGLLSLSRVGRAELRRRSVDTAKLIEGIVGSLSHTGGEQPIHWEVGRLPAVEADPVLLRLVFQNLIDNAVKFSATEDRPAIKISAVEEGGYVSFSIEDNGVGFDMRFADKLFVVFQRLHAQTDFEGTGVGLATVRRIVERHGGTIRAWGEVGKGATFTVDIPAR